MKIAFCFLTRGDLLQKEIWQAYFSGAPHDQISLWSHPKEPDAIRTGPLAGHIIDERVTTEHGSISLVLATLNLFTTAYRADSANEFFILLSESTIPIVSFKRLSTALRTVGQRSILPFSVPARNSEPHQRLFALRQPSLFAHPFYHHEQWIILHRRHVGLLIDQPFLDQFQNVFAADEHYFLNVLVHQKGAVMNEFVNRKATFTNWREMEIRTYTNPISGQAAARTAHPKTYKQLSAADVADARAKGSWFFRKVAQECDCSAAWPSEIGLPPGPMMISG